MRRVMLTGIVMAGLLIGSGTAHAQWSHILSDTPVLEDDFEDNTIDTDTWLTSGDVIEKDGDGTYGRIVSSITCPIGGSGYYTAGFMSNQTFDINGGQTEFAAEMGAYTVDMYNPGITWICNDNFQKTGYAVFIYKYWKIELQKYVNGGNTLLYSGSVPANWASWSLVLDGSENWSFYYTTTGLVGVTADDLKASGSNGPTATQMGSSLVTLHPEMNNMGNWSYFDGQTYNVSIRHALVVSEQSTAPGDYNGDGMVTDADYTIWADTYLSTTDLCADGNGDGTITDADYTIWADNYGTGTLPVPEPLTIGLMALGTTGAARRRG